MNVFAQSVWDGTATPWTNGSGTEDDPYLIETPSHIAYLAEKVNEGYQASGQIVFDGVYFLQTDDFDLNNINWTPIGAVDMSLNGFGFGGFYDGDYHEVTKMSINSSAAVVGFFGAAAGGAVIKHVFVNQANIVTTGAGAAGLVGGIAGEAAVLQCGFSGSISVNNNGSYCGAGGVVGVAAQNASISQCYFKGSVSATNNGGFTTAAAAGGICAYAQDMVSISGCYNTGSVTASAMLFSIAGGILAATVNEANVKMSSCYNVGTLSASNKGGVFGMISPISPKAVNGVTVSNCFYLNTVASPNNYGTAKTSAEMKTVEFKNELNQSTNTFVMDNGTNNGYPVLGFIDLMVYEATEITYNSAKLSADIHQGNASFSRACFIYTNDGEEMNEVDVATDGYVETVLENLEENTDYMFGMRLYFDDSNFIEYYPLFFKTEIDAVDEVISNEMMIFPNPATDFIYMNNSEYNDIQIFTLDGKMIKSGKDVNVVDVRDLASGAYLININGKVARFVKR